MELESGVSGLLNAPILNCDSKGLILLSPSFFHRGCEPEFQSIVIEQRDVLSMWLVLKHSVMECPDRLPISHPHIVNRPFSLGGALR